MLKRKKISSKGSCYPPSQNILQKRRQKFRCSKEVIPNNPVIITQDHDQQLDIIQQARLTGYYETMKVVRSLKLNGSLSSKKRKAQENIKQYFQQKLGINLDSRQIPLNFIDYDDSDTHIQSNALIITGIDLMSRNYAVAYMRYFEPTQIIFLSTSTMKIVFQTNEITSKALYANLHNNVQKQQQGFSFSNLLLSQKDPFAKGHLLSKQKWYEIIPYSVFGIQIPLYARFATNLDIKLEEQIQSGRYQKIKQLKQSLKQRALNVNQDAPIVFKDSSWLPPYFQKHISKQDIEFKHKSRSIDTTKSSNRKKKYRQISIVNQRKRTENKHVIQVIVKKRLSLDK